MNLSLGFFDAVFLKKRKMAWEIVSKLFTTFYSC